MDRRGWEQADRTAWSTPLSLPPAPTRRWTEGGGTRARGEGAGWPCRLPATVRRVVTGCRAGLWDRGGGGKSPLHEGRAPRRAAAPPRPAAHQPLSPSLPPSARFVTPPRHSLLFQPKSRAFSGRDPRVCVWGGGDCGAAASAGQWQPPQPSVVDGAAAAGRQEANRVMGSPATTRRCRGALNHSCVPSAGRRRWPHEGGLPVCSRRRPPPSDWKQTAPAVAVQTLLMAPSGPTFASSYCRYPYGLPWRRSVGGWSMLLMSWDERLSEDVAMMSKPHPSLQWPHRVELIAEAHLAYIGLEDWHSWVMSSGGKGGRARRLDRQQHAQATPP